eukprot:3750538-Pleurochrysis_carterae.AAC.2
MRPALYLLFRRRVRTFQPCRVGSTPLAARKTPRIQSFLNAYYVRCHSHSPGEQHLLRRRPLPLHARERYLERRLVHTCAACSCVHAGSPAATEMMCARFSLRQSLRSVSLVASTCLCRVHIFLTACAVACAWAYARVCAHANTQARNIYATSTQHLCVCDAPGSAGFRQALHAYSCFSQFPRAVVVDMQR